MPTMSYTFGAIGCTHLGYAARGMRMDPATGRNQRVTDSALAYDLAVVAMISAGCAGIWHGGDMFHHSRPRPADINTALTADQVRYDAGLWAGVNSGNHDAGAGADLSAVSVLHRPTVNCHAVFAPDPRDTRPVTGPFSGLYEIIKPDPNADLYLHVVSHYGLDPALRDAGIIIDPRPLDHGINILCAHGIFVADERLYKAAERHGADRLVPTEWVTRDWNVVLLSDFHTPGPVPGFGTATAGQVWYTGSTARRGFADEPSPRGWLKVDIADSGDTTVTLRPIWQRPQTDLPPIDADGKTAAEINDLVRARLAAGNWTDELTDELTGHGGSIVRQRIVGASPTMRADLRPHMPSWAESARDTVSWSVSFDHPPAQPRLGHLNTTAVPTLGANVADLGAQLRARLVSPSGHLGAAIAATLPQLRVPSAEFAVDALSGPQHQ